MSFSSFKGSTKNLFDFELSQNGMETNSLLIFEEITIELEAYLSRQSNNEDSTDGIVDFLSSLSDSGQEEFYESISGDSDKIRFL